MRLSRSATTARIAELEQANRQLQHTADVAEKRKPITKISMIGNETPLTMVQANTRDYIERTFIVVGGISVQDYYNFGYLEAKDTHVSLGLEELRADRSSTMKSIDVYLRREWSQPLVDVLTEGVAKGFRSTLIRAKLTILANRYEDDASTAELLDWQFLDKERNSWKPWVLSGTSTD